MAKPLRLYWVECPDRVENTFVVASSRESASRFEEDSTGFDRGDCNATLVTDLDPAWVKKSYSKTKQVNDCPDPFYPTSEDLRDLGIHTYIFDGDEIFCFRGVEYAKLADTTYVAGLGSRKALVRSVRDLLEILDVEGERNRVYRGHRDWRWHLLSSLHRVFAQSDAEPGTIREFQQRLMDEFRRRVARWRWEDRPPQSEWEWLFLAQHSGLPTRLLDWSENPLVALYFAVRDPGASKDDAVIYCYQHASEAITLDLLSKSSDGDRIELVRPPFFNEQMYAQRSVFTVEPYSVKDTSNNSGGLSHWYISHKCVARIRSELKELGISEATLFPGLRTLAEELREEAMGWLAAPRSCDGGGRVVAAGTPEEVAACPESYTGQYLKRVLKRRGPARANGRNGSKRHAAE